MSYFLILRLALDFRILRRRKATNQVIPKLSTKSSSSSKRSLCPLINLRFQLTEILNNKHPCMFALLDLQWFNEYPQFLPNPLYIAGDSYSGMIVPTVASAIARGNFPCLPVSLIFPPFFFFTAILRNSTPLEN